MQLEDSHANKRKRVVIRKMPLGSWRHSLAEDTEESFIKELRFWGACVAQSAKCLPRDFGSGHDLTVHEFKPHIGLCAGHAEPAWDSLSPSPPLSAPLLLTHSLFLSKNK